MTGKRAVHETCLKLTKGCRIAGGIHEADFVISTILRTKGDFSEWYQERKTPISPERLLTATKMVPSFFTANPMSPVVAEEAAPNSAVPYAPFALPAVPAVPAKLYTIPPVTLRMTAGV